MRSELVWVNSFALVQVAKFILNPTIIVATEKGGLTNGTLSVYSLLVFRVTYRPIAKANKAT